MIITKIEQQKTKNNRSSVFIDDNFAFGIDNFDLYTLKLKVGTEISEQELDKIKETIIFTSAKEYSVDLVSRFTYTKKAIRDKLRNRKYDDITIEKVINFLEEYKLVDDYDYAKRYINDCLKIKCFGIQKIKYELYNKGIDENIIAEVLSEIDIETLQSEGILVIAKKKLAGNFEYKNILKTKNYLVTKGFSYDLIDRTINDLLQEKGE